MKSGAQKFREDLLEEKKRESETKSLIESINGLKVELSGFRSEMKEFKRTVEIKIDSLDTRSTACQFNPNVCATARRLEEHIKSDSGKTGRTTAIIACVISCFNVAVTVITLIVKGM